MRSNFTVECPRCHRTNDFTGDNWDDRFIDDSQSHGTTCQHCGKEFDVVVSAVYTLAAELPEDDDEDEVAPQSDSGNGGVR